MRRMGLFVGVVLLLLLVPPFAGPVATQEEPGNVALVVFVKAKPGMQKQYEEGLKRHRNWHRQQNDSWTWLTWEVISGDSTGTYVSATFGHRWEDFDTPSVSDEADAADREANTAPYVESVVVRYYAYLAEVSRPTDTEGPSPLTSVLVFHLKFGKDAQFNYAIRKFHQAVGKTNWPFHYEWYRLVNGGEHPTYALVLPRKNWAGFKPMEKSSVEMLEEAYGRQGAELLLHKFERAVRSEHSEISRSRPDLSYVPAGQ